MRRNPLGGLAIHRLTSRRQAGFTLVELLVVISIIGILVGLLLPAVQAARESGRRTTCLNNVKNIALGVQSYQSTWGCLPPGVPSCTQPANLWITGGTQAGAFCQGPNWLSQILVQLDQQQQAEWLSACMTLTSAHAPEKNACDDCEHAMIVNGVYKSDNTIDGLGVGTSTPPSLICPSAPVMTPEQRVGSKTETFELELLAKGNYAANFGADTYMSFQDSTKAGAFGVVPVYVLGKPAHLLMEGGQPVYPQDATSSPKASIPYGHKEGVNDASIKDGKTFTLLLSEVVGYDSHLDVRGAWTNPGPGASSFTGKYGPNSIISDQIAICGFTAPASGNPDPLACTQNRNDGNIWASARSAHPGGVNAAMVDGSARFFSDTTDPSIWRALTTRANGGLENLTALPE